MNNRFQQLTRGRLVVPARPPGASAQALAPQTDGPLARIAKYIPAEIVAVYLFFDNGLKGFIADGTEPKVGGTEFWCSVAVVLACWIGAPLYYWMMDGAPGVRKAHAIMAAFAFPVWAYASGGPFVAFKIQQPIIALTLLALVTLTGVFVKPPPSTPTPQSPPS